MIEPLLRYLWPEPVAEVTGQSCGTKPATNTVLCINRPSKTLTKKDLFAKRLNSSEVPAHVQNKLKTQNLQKNSGGCHRVEKTVPTEVDYSAFWLKVGRFSDLHAFL